MALRSDFLGEGLLLGLECEVSDAKPGSRDRPLGAARRARGQPDVQRSRVELGLGLIVGAHVEEDDPLGFRRACPVSGRGLERQAADRRIDDAVGSGADEAAASVGGRRVLGDAERGVAPAP